MGHEATQQGLLSEFIAKHLPPIHNLWLEFLKKQYIFMEFYVNENLFYKYSVIGKIYNFKLFFKIIF